MMRGMKKIRSPLVPGTIFERGLTHRETEQSRVKSGRASVLDCERLGFLKSLARLCGCVCIVCLVCLCGLCGCVCIVCLV